MLLRARVAASIIFTVLFASSMWSEHGCKNQEVLFLDGSMLQVSWDGTEGV